MKLPQRPNVVRYETTDSTNERAFAAIADGTAQHGDVHWADFQTAGRGRLGRQWRAGEGEGLLLSVILFPPANGPKPTELTVATCLALHDMAREYGIAGAHLKWPNDLLIGESKLSGILLETRGLDEAKPHFVVGIGLNVKQREFPREVTDERPVTSLALEGVALTREEVLALVWKRLAVRLEQDALTLFEDYTSSLALGDEVLVRSARAEVRGELVSLDSTHGVRVRTASGEVIDTQLEFVRELR